MRDRSFYDEGQYRVFLAVITKVHFDYNPERGLSLKITVAFPNGGDDQTFHITGSAHDDVPAAVHLEHQLRGLFGALGICSVTEMSDRACEAYLLVKSCDESGHEQICGIGHHNGTAGYLLGPSDHALKPEHLLPVA